MPTPLFSEFFKLQKRHKHYLYHSDLPRHAFAHCGVFAAAAPRRARTLVSVSFWGLPLSWPLRIIGLVSRYLTNYLILRNVILRLIIANSIISLIHQALQHRCTIVVYPQFPVVIHLLRVDSLRVTQPFATFPRENVKLACLSLSPIAVSSSRINWNRYTNMFFSREFKFRRGI